MSLKMSQSGKSITSSPDHSNTFAMSYYSHLTPCGTIDLPNGESKRLRHKDSYQDIHNEKRNFVNYAVDLSQSAKLSHSQDSFKSKGELSPYHTIDLGGSSTLNKVYEEKIEETLTSLKSKGVPHSYFHELSMNNLRNNTNTSLSVKRTPQKNKSMKKSNSTNDFKGGRNKLSLSCGSVRGSKDKNNKRKIPSKGKGKGKGALKLPIKRNVTDLNKVANSSHNNSKEKERVQEYEKVILDESGSKSSRFAMRSPIKDDPIFKSKVPNNYSVKIEKMQNIKRHIVYEEEKKQRDEYELKKRTIDQANQKSKIMQEERERRERQENKENIYNNNKPHYDLIMSTHKENSRNNIGNDKSPKRTVLDQKREEYIQSTHSNRSNTPTKSNEKNKRQSAKGHSPSPLKSSRKTPNKTKEIIAKFQQQQREKQKLNCPNRDISPKSPENNTNHVFRQYSDIKNKLIDDNSPNKINTEQLNEEHSFRKKETDKLNPSQKTTAMTTAMFESINPRTKSHNTTFKTGQEDLHNTHDHPQKSNRNHVNKEEDLPGSYTIKHMNKNKIHEENEDSLPNFGSSKMQSTIKKSNYDNANQSKISFNISSTENEDIDPFHKPKDPHHLKGHHKRYDIKRNQDNKRVYDWYHKFSKDNYYNTIDRFNINNDDLYDEKQKNFISKAYRIGSKLNKEINKLNAKRTIQIKESKTMQLVQSPSFYNKQEQLFNSTTHLNKNEDDDSFYGKTNKIFNTNYNGGNMNLLSNVTNRVIKPIPSHYSSNYNPDKKQYLLNLARNEFITKPPLRRSESVGSMVFSLNSPRNDNNVMPSNPFDSVVKAREFFFFDQ